MKIMWSFDDGTIDDLRAAELLDKYDQYGIFYFTVMPHTHNEKKGRPSLSPKDRRDIAKRFEIGSHTCTHPLLTRIEPRKAKQEIEDSKYMLEQEFDINITSFAYPRGYANPEIQTAVKDAGYSNARSTLVGYIHPSENPFFTQTTVHMADRKEYGGHKWLDYATNLLEEAIKTPESVYHVWGHSYEITEQDGWHDFEELLKRVNESTHTEL